MPEKEIRLNPSSYAVLALIKAAGESTPYELKALLEKSVENFWPIPHTTFYAEPARLATGGYLSERQEKGGRRRKLYDLTGRGRQALEEWVHDEEYPPPQLRDDGALKIFAGADPIPILERRAEWHRAKLVELEGYLELTNPDDGFSGPRGSLLAGITYHRALLRAIEDFVEGGPPPSGRETESAVP